MNKEQIFSEIKECRLCNSEKLSDVLDLGAQPPANSLREDRNEVLPTAPLKLVQCEQCSCVQLTATVDPEYLFNQYVWVTATSKTARDYSEFYATEVLKRTQSKNPFVVEVASNDGTFLSKFQSKGCSVLGVDPAKNIAQKATQDGIPTLAEFFNEKISQKILAEHQRPNVVMARNVIPHVKEIHSIAKGMSDLVDKDGLVVVEFHYADAIIKELHYDSIYHEHLFYFSLKSLTHLFEKYGLYSFDAFSSPISGGSIALFFSKERKSHQPFLKELVMTEEKSGLNHIDTWKKFGAEATQHAKDLKKIVSDYAKQKRLVAYGASARSSTMLNFAQISDQEIEYVIDKSPLKHNLYTPGTNIKIISYEEGINKLEGRTLLLLAWNFEQEIIKDLRSSGFKGDIIVPLPNQVRVIRGSN